MRLTIKHPRALWHRVALVESREAELVGAPNLVEGCLGELRTLWPERISDGASKWIASERHGRDIQHLPAAFRREFANKVVGVPTGVNDHDRGVAFESRLDDEVEILFDLLANDGAACVSRIRIWVVNHNEAANAAPCDAGVEPCRKHAAALNREPVPSRVLLARNQYACRLGNVARLP